MLLIVEDLVGTGVTAGASVVDLAVATAADLACPAVKATKVRWSYL